ncbi:cystathionine beta-synthase [Tulasnella sp. JGI-2019a]|nr:cystathionine beta-synthase [Tulasnella sp. JGI-2019a]KAG9033530.1 cystathionine beta-synthase [Tulasnella sp. JGI-2019a]
MATPCNRKLILDDVLDGVGKTPLVRLNRIAKAHGLKCNLLAKVEFYSSGGSVKDRIGKRMVEEAEKDGRLIPGKSVVIEPTSGNTGIGLALACAMKGYPCVITLPEKMSLEKEVTLRALGAEIIRTPTSAPSWSPDSNLGVAKRLEQTIPGGIILNQYENPNNMLSHLLETGPEIIHAITTTKSTPQHPSSEKVDVLFAGAGTGGTISGLSKAIKLTHNPDCFVVGVDPMGSVFSGPPKHSGGWQIEGIGYDHIPPSLNYEHIDTWQRIPCEEAFAMACQLIREEALLIGGSSGAAVAAAVKYLKSPAGFERFGNVEGLNVVIVCPDSIRNYMSSKWFLDGTIPKVPTKLSSILTDALEETKPEDSPHGIPRVTGNLAPPKLVVHKEKKFSESIDTSNPVVSSVVNMAIPLTLVASIASLAFWLRKVPTA